MTHHINCLIRIAAITVLAHALTVPLMGQGSGNAGLVLHYDFDENFSSGEVLDVSGNGNNGWQFDPTNWITATNGVFGTTAAQFTYVGIMTNDYPHVYQYSQYIGITNLNGFAYLTNGTISIWAKFDTNADNGMYLLDCGYNVQYAGAQASNSWTFGRQFTPYLCFTVYPAGGGGQTIVTWPNDTVRSGGYNPDLATTAFHLYTVTIDCPANQVIAYYDGAPYMTNTIGLPWLHVFGCSSIPWLCVGAMAHNGTPQWGDDKYPNSGFFVGKMDDLRIYNRTLSAAEVQALYIGDTFVTNLAIQPVGGGSVQLGWTVNPNANYQVEYEPTLIPNTWAPLGLPITNGIGSFTDSTLLDPSRFYRVRVLH